MKRDQYYRIFKKGSKTYFNSSIFFPDDVRRKVFILYGFVRVADDFVDAIPQDADGFYSFADQYRKVRDGNLSGNEIIDNFVELEQSLDFDPQWTEAFLHSMELDITKKEYSTMDETLEYIYGSAEVIGLYMSRILGLSEKALTAAKMLGRTMQYINFIRDIQEDNMLGRRYLPKDETYSMSLEESVSRENPEQFTKYIRKQIQFFTKWQNEAEKGFCYIPKRYLIPIKTAGDMYLWTAKKIQNNPFLIYKKKVKPSKFRIFFTIVKNSFLKHRFTA